jgi:hypothetical protein
MRTTVTLEPDVARLVDQAMHRERRTFKEVINDALRRGLRPTGARERVARYRVTPHVAKLAAGYDRRGFNKLADELEDRAVLGKSKRAT